MDTSGRVWQTRTACPLCRNHNKCTKAEATKFNHFDCADVRCRTTTIGYARVSTDGQTLDAQHAALREAGATQIYSEKISGAVTERKALARAIAALGPGDVLLVTRLDRLARSTRNLLNVLDAVAKAAAGFKSLADSWADTTTAHGHLMLTVLGGLAEFERELIRARTDEGRKRAQARGVRFGRRLKLTVHQRQEVLERRRRARRWLILRGDAFWVVRDRRGGLGVSTQRRPFNKNRTLAQSSE
jgi:DNA invertase Pin-like site-specific DNA recombinase